MADKTSDITGQDAATVEAKRVHQEALEKILQSLDARKNRLFDPTLLAFAQAMLTPGQTGSFGEALGRAAGAVGASEAQMAKEEQELAKMRFDVAQQGMQLERQKSRERFLMGQMEPPAPGGAAAPSAPGALPQAGLGAPTGVPAGAQTAAASQPPGTEGIKGEPFMPPNPDVANKLKLLQAALQDPNKSMFDVAKELQELQRRRTIDHPEGIVDLATGLIYRTKKPDITPVNIQLRTIPGLEGQTISVATTRAREHDEAMKEAMAGKPERLRALERSLTSTFAEQPAKQDEAKEDPRITAAVTQATGRTDARGRIPTSQESEAAAAAQKEIATLTAKDLATRTNTVRDDAKTAASVMPIIEQLRVFSEGPTANRVFGPLTNNRVLDQIVLLAESGVGMSGFNLGIPAVRDVVNNLRLTPEEQRDLQLVGQLLVRLQLGITAAERGPGSVTEYERRLFAQAKITRDDTPATVRSKIESMGRAYKYQMDLADKLQDTGMQYDQFIRTNEGRQLYRQYLTDMTNMVGRLPAAQASREAAPRPASATPARTPAAPRPAPATPKPGDFTIRQVPGG